MSWSFKKEVRKNHKREVASLHKEMGENDEAYYLEAERAGYTNAEDYEEAIHVRMMKWFLWSVMIILAAITVTLIYVGKLKF